MADLIRPEEHQRFLGKHFVDRQHEIVLKIGQRTWDRVDLIQKVGVGNLGAAAALSTTLRKAEVKSVKELFEIDPRDLASVKGLGETTVYVAMAILKAEGFDATSWYMRVDGFKKRAVTFRTLKIRDQRERAKARRKRGKRYDDRG